MPEKSCFPVILAGGAGSRLWPLSRRRSPKPFLPLEDGRSLLRATFDRAARLAPRENIWVITSRALLSQVAKHLPQLSAENLVGEPVGRNTAPAIGLAAALIAERDPEGLLAILPADHAIEDEELFSATARRALLYAAQGKVVTLGLSPSRPETGYGYLHLGEPLENEAFYLRRFVEKPSREKALSFVESGEFLWNSGMFFFSAARILEAIETHIPALRQGLRQIVQKAKQESLPAALDLLFPGLPDVSIDYGVMEKLEEVVTLTGRFGWDDIGTLSAYAALSGGRPPLEIEGRGSVVLGETERPVAVVGADDLIIVDTKDALLICKKSESQRVREVVQALEKKGRLDLL